MEIYTPGNSPSVTSFMARRTLASHGAFFRPFLWAGARVLDCGCGPGTITSGIAACVAPGGTVTAIDADPGQVEIAKRMLDGIPGVECRVAGVYALPFEDHHFDAVFSHALFEHLSEPLGAAREISRVLKPGRVVGVRSPDWTGKLAAPVGPGLDKALEYYSDMQAANGGNLRIGRTLGGILANAGFSRIRVTASYECYSPVSLIGDYLAEQIEKSSGLAHARPSGPDYARVLRAWSALPIAFFAQAWCEAVGQK